MARQRVNAPGPAPKGMVSMQRKPKHDVRDMLARLDRERVAAGVCRHCGGPVPCWSPYGDVRVGVRHDRRSA